MMSVAHEADLIAAVRRRAAWRDAGLRVVFTNGCFDIMHAGHTAYLDWARSQGDVLIVGLNDDESVRGLKGETRPIVLFEERRTVLQALRSVDLVVGFRERTPEFIIDALAPDVHVKSAQYRLEDLPERAVVESHGGIIALAPHIDGVSSTDIITRILRSAR